MPVSKRTVHLLNLFLCVVIAAAAGISPARAQMDPRVSELLLRLETQEQQIRDLERRLRELEPVRQQGASTSGAAQALAEGLSGPDLDRLRGRGSSSSLRSTGAVSCLAYPFSPGAVAGAFNSRAASARILFIACPSGAGLLCPQAPRSGPAVSGRRAASACRCA